MRRRGSSKELEATPRQVDLIEEVKGTVNRDAWMHSLGRVDQGIGTPLLNMELDEYLEHLDWTGRQVGKGKRGKPDFQGQGRKAA